MGVRANLLAVTLTAGDVTQAESLGIDCKGELSLAIGAVNDSLARLNFLLSNVLTPASDAANISTVNTAITALS